MGKFLNRESIRQSINEIFSTSKNEVIIIVPYIKLSDDTFKLLRETDARGIEITIIYKEEEMKKVQKDKLYTLQNLNLLSHPDIHAKCYCNEFKMVIASMNLYEYSEKYNREMGVLLDLEEGFFDDEEFDSAKEEIRSIINSAKLEKRSRNTQKNGFNIKMLKSASEYLRLSCKLVNKYFDNKIFDLSNENEICCTNYIDNITVIIEPDMNEEINEQTGEFVIGRAALKFNWHESVTEKVHSEFHFKTNKNTFPNFRIYWNAPHNKLTIYRDWKRQPKWEELSNEQTVKKFRQGIDLVTESLKKIEKKLR